MQLEQTRPSALRALLAPSRAPFCALARSAACHVPGGEGSSHFVACEWARRGGGKEGVDRLRQKRKRVRERIAKRKERTNKKKTDFFFSDLDLDGECSFLRSSLLFFPSLVPPPVAGTLAGSAGEKGRKTRATTSSQQQPWKSFQQCVRAREKSLKNFPPVCARKTDERKETSKTLRHASPFFPLSFPLCFCLFTS